MRLAGFDVGLDSSDTGGLEQSFERFLRHSRRHRRDHLEGSVDRPPEGPDQVAFSLAGSTLKSHENGDQVGVFHHPTAHLRSGRDSHPRKQAPTQHQSHNPAKRLHC